MTEKTIHIKKGEFLIREGEVGKEMYYLTSGSMEVIRHKAAEEVLLGYIYSGELVGEMSFLDKMPRCASVRALQDCEVTVIPHEKFEKVINGLPRWYRGLVQTLLERLRKTNKKIKV